MLGHDELLAWFDRRAIPEPTRGLINQIRSSGPSRRVGGGHSNVSGRYPSRKMGVTVQFESHRVELAGIYEMEHDAIVLEYFDQPPAIKLDYESVAGKRIGVLHTPDFFVIRREEAGWEEWKTEEELCRLNGHNPNRYAPGGDEPWRCAPGQAYAEQLGLYYRVRSSAEIDWVFQRNIQFLEDYLRADSTAVEAGSRDIVMAYVLANPSLTLEDLVRATAAKVQPDDIFRMIAANHIYVDIHAAPLAEPSRVEVYSSAEAASTAKTNGSGKPQFESPFRLQCGSSFNWDARHWTVINVGDSSIGLLSERREMVELPIAAFDTLVQQKRIQIVSEYPRKAFESTAMELLSKASESDLRTANCRADLVNRYLYDQSLPAEADTSLRSFLRWVTRYRHAQTTYGTGYLGLLPHHSAKGNRTPRLSEAVRRAMTEVLEHDYETKKQKTLYSSWIKLKLCCENKGIVAPSYKTFTVAAGQRDPYRQRLKRQGHRSAYLLEPFYWELDLKTPRHGDRPLEIGHIDHTELDVEVVSSRTGRVLGRPWMTLLIDAYSRRVAAIYLTFDPPSYRSCMMVLRECVRRHNRLPQIVVVDGGKEFSSTYFEALLANYECTKKQRPPAKARFGSLCERMFGVSNTQFIHNLRGNTLIMRNVRQVTKSVNPKGLAVWSLGELHDRLREYLYEVYDTADHPALGQSPREAFFTRLAETGERRHRMIPYDEAFLVLTMPTTTRGTAKVLSGRGVKIHHVYYWCEAFRDSEVQGQQIAVRFDPFDAGVAYAFVHKQWVQCHSEHYATLKGRSEREVMLATQELHQRCRNHAASFAVSARQLAEFLESVEAEEVLLSQRLNDLESKTIRLTLSSGCGEVNSVTHGCEESTVEIDSQPKDGFVVDEMYGDF